MTRPKTSQWGITFRPEQVEAGRRTMSWNVSSDQKGKVHYLGHIEWFSQWRCYVFFPWVRTAFDAACLGDIADFCERATRTHNAEVRKAREAGKASGPGCTP